MEIKDESYSSGNPASNSPPRGAPNASSPQPGKGSIDFIGASKTLGAIVAIAGVGFTFGRYLEEAKMHETVAKLQAENVVKSTDLDKSKVDISTWSAAYRELQQKLAQKEADISRLSQAVVAQQGCEYFKNQIESTKRDISSAQYSGIFAVDGEKLSEQRKADIARLDKHLSELIGALNGCRGRAV